MADTTLKALKTLSLQVIDKYAQDNDDTMQLLDYACEMNKTSARNEYTGRWKVEIRKPSEADIENKTLYIEIEIEGTFVSNRPFTETKAKELLFPHLTKKLKSLLETAGIRTDFIPESVLNGLVVSSEE